MELYDNVIPEIGYYVYRKCHTNWVIDKNIIDFHDLTFIVSGNGTYRVNDADIPVTTGDIIYITPGSTRQAWTSQDNLIELYAINFQLLTYGNINNQSLLPFSLINKVGYDQKLIYLFKLLTRIWMEKNALYMVEARAAALQIISELIRRLYHHKPAASFDERIEKVKDYINENYHLPLTASRLAEIARLNDVYLGSLFKKSEGCSIKEYINKIRINHASDIIQTEGLPVAEAAYRCGYTDAFYFCRVFKKYNGFPPSEINKHA